MRKVVVLAAVVAALAMASQPAEARDRGFGFRHFSGHAAPKLHLRHQGFKFHHGGSLGKPRPLKLRHFGHFNLRHFGHFNHSGFAFKFGHVPRLKPRDFGHVGQGGLVLKFGDVDVVLRFGDVPRFKHRHFGHKHGRQGAFFGFNQPGQFRRWPHRDFAFEDRRHLHVHSQSMPGSQGGQGGGLHPGAPPEALLEQLEQMGFRDVPVLLRAGSLSIAPVQFPIDSSSRRQANCATCVHAWIGVVVLPWQR